MKLEGFRTLEDMGAFPDGTEAAGFELAEAKAVRCR